MSLKEEVEESSRKKSIIITTTAANDEAYQNFINSLQSEYTKKSYRKTLKNFLSFLQIKDNDSSKLLQYDVKTMENLVRDYILDMRRRNLSLSTINCSCAALKHFFDINDFDLRWSKKLVKFKGNRRDNAKKNELRGYTIDEIHRLVNSAQDQRTKVMILLMCSSGIRVGTFLSLRIRNLIPINKYGIYQVVVYENTSSKHYTFCSQECRKEIDNYIEFRKRNGENIRPESPLIREQFNTRNRIGSAKPRFKKYRSLTKMIEQVINIDAGINNKKEEEGPTSIITTQTHSFRRFWETSVIKEGLSPLYANILMNHDVGLEKSYFKPTVTDLLEGSDKMRGYIHVMNAVTINDEYRLQKENQELKDKDDYSKFVIEKQMKEKDEEIAILRNGFDSLKDSFKKTAESLGIVTDIVLKMDKQKQKEKKLDRDFEVETDPDIKDQKFDKMLAATRETIKKRSELEKTVKQQLQK